MNYFLALFISVISLSAWADQTWSSGAQVPGTYTGVTTISGTTVTLAAGTYNFDTLVVSGTASALSNTGSNLGVTINATTVTISGTLKADATGKLTNVGTGSTNSGGSYGGYGGRGTTVLAPVTYGSATNPIDLGSGGRSYFGSNGGTGGGAIFLNVSGTLTINGILSANGGNGITSASGGGSGGSLKILTSTLAGIGTISVNGGTGMGGGGGGRAYVSYSTSNTYTGAHSAAGGTVSGGGTAGTPGSFLVVDSTNNDLYIKANSSLPPTEFTYRNITVASGVTLNVDGMGSFHMTGTGAGASQNGASYGGLGGRFDGAITEPFGSVMAPTDLGSGGGNYFGSFGGMGGGAVNLIATGTLQLDGNISAKGTVGDSSCGGGSGGSVYLRSVNLAGAGSVSVNGGNGGLNGGGGGGGRIAVFYSGTNSFTGTFVTTGGTAGTRGGSIGSALLIDSTNNDLYIIANSSLPTGDYSFRNVTVNSGVSLALDGMGNKAATGSGAGTSQVGGGYGGTGGGYDGSNGKTYGTVLNPNQMGSGGGSYFGGLGGRGGGALKLTVTGQLTVSGTLSSNGTAGSSTSDGAGSGGSLWLIINTLAGNGVISANGANGGSASAGGGGGGRIHIKYVTNNYTGTAVATAGTQGSPVATTGTVIFTGTAGGLNCTVATTIVINSSDIGANGGELNLSNGCKMTINGDIYPTSVSVTGAGTVLTQNGHLIVTSTIDVTTSGAIVMGGNTVMNSGYTVSAASINIGSTASINANGMGHAVGSAGAGAPGASTYGGGGGHGGRGANATDGAPGGSAYGSVYQAATWGFAGAYGISGTGAGKGGGAITFVVPGTMTVNGTLAANGITASSYSGGGAGGSLWLTVGTIAGTGAMTVTGGTAAGGGGGGGGGYIYVYYTSANTYTQANAVATRGTGGKTDATKSTDGVVLFTTVGGSAVKLSYVGQPSPTVRKNVILPQQPLLVAKDSSDNIVSGFSGAVTIAAFTDATCTSSAVGSLTQTPNVINGVVLYSDVSYNSTGVIYIKATSAGLTSACSALVKVGGEVATQLVFTTQPSTTATAGANFVQQAVVTAQDANGNTDILAGLSGVSAYTDASCLTLATGGALSGTGTVNEGVTTFINGRYTKASTIYLGASQTLEGNLIKGCSTAIVVSPAVVSRLAYTTAPSSSAQAGVLFAAQPVVEAQDAYGNTITSYSVDFTLAAFSNAACTTAASGTLTGGVYTPSNGEVIVSGMGYDTVGTVYIGATSGALTKACSAVTISAGPASRLVFIVQPANTGVEGVNLRNAQAAVGSTDQYGNPVAFTNTPTVKMYTDAACMVEAATAPIFAGATAGAGVNRTYTFTRLRFGQSGTYYVGASYSGLTLACSSSVALLTNVPLFFRGY